MELTQQQRKRLLELRRGMFQHLRHIFSERQRILSQLQVLAPCTWRQHASTLRRMRSRTACTPAVLPAM